MYLATKTGFTQSLNFRQPVISLFVIFFITVKLAYAEQDSTNIIEVQLGSYQFMPQEIQLGTDQAVILRLSNRDSIIPHNFTIEDPTGELDINVDVAAGESVDVKLNPTRPGRYTYYCSKKLLFMKSHREKGMEGVLNVVAKPQ